MTVNINGQHYFHKHIRKIINVLKGTKIRIAFKVNGWLYYTWQNIWQEQKWSV